MSSREYAKAQIDALPDGAVEKVVDFIAYQRYSLGLPDGDDFDSDSDYLASIPGMVESIKAASAEPLDCYVPAREIWPDV
jgi:hypothetical protein